MIELILVRHAKSDWGDPALDDHDRPLNARGRRNAPLMAAHVAQLGVSPQRILSSTALRARTTADVFSDVLDVEVTLDRSLYLASASALLSAAADSGSSPVMIFAHDPGITDLAANLSNGRISHMPTCAVARFTWNVDSWGEALTRQANSWSFDTPRALGASGSRIIEHE